MSNHFERAMKELLSIEGEYSDISEDRGGKTNWGITERLARRYGYEGDMKELPLKKAEDIYYREFWDADRLKLPVLVDITGHEIAYEIFEQAVNTGVSRTGKSVQRVLNILNRDEELYLDLKVDGWLGTASKDAFVVLMRAGDSDDILRWLNVAQGRHYFDLCEEDPSQETFARGWVHRRVMVKGG